MTAAIGESGEVHVERGEYPDEYDEKVVYEKRADGWYVKTPKDDDFWLFARGQARERDVVQLINKKWCGRYNPSPDAFYDQS